MKCQSDTEFWCSVLEYGTLAVYISSLIMHLLCSEQTSFTVSGKTKRTDHRCSRNLENVADVSVFSWGLLAFLGKDKAYIQFIWGSRPYP